MTLPLDANWRVLVYAAALAFALLASWWRGDFDAYSVSDDGEEEGW